MKTLLAIVFSVSIFLTGDICNAQTKDQQSAEFMLCDTKPGNIKQTHLLEILDNNCLLLNIFDDEGNAMPIHSYTFGYAPSNGEGAYFELANTNLMTPTIKDRLRMAKVDTKIIFTNIHSEINGKKILLTDYSFTVTE